MRIETTIAWLTARQLLARRRRLPVLLLALMPVVIAALFRFGSGEDPTGFVLSISDQLIIRIVLPIIALILGTGAFGAERDEGTALYLLTKPIARWRIAAAKLATVAAVTLLIVVASTALTAAVALGGLGTQGIVTGLATGLGLGAVLYAAMFVTLGLFFRRALPVGLMYVLVWEVVAAQMFAGTRTLSVRQYVLSTASRMMEVPAEALGGTLTARTVLVMSVVVLALSGALSVYRLRAFEVLDQQ